MNNNDFIPIVDILSDVTELVGDRDMSRGLSKGFYVRQISEAIESLAIETYFQKLTEDLPFPKENLQLSLPANCFNVRNYANTRTVMCKAARHVPIQLALV